MKNNRLNTVLFLLVVVLILLIVSVLWTIRLVSTQTQQKCITMPRKFVMNNPDCVNKLFETMNFTQVQIVVMDTPNTGKPNK